MHAFKFDSFYDELDFLNWVQETKGPLKTNPVIIQATTRRLSYGQKTAKIQFINCDRLTESIILFNFIVNRYLANQQPIPAGLEEQIHVMQRGNPDIPDEYVYVGKMHEAPGFQEWADRHPMFAPIQTNKYLKELMLGNQQLRQELDTIKQQMVMLTDVMANSMRLELDYVKKSAQEREELMKTWPGQAGLDK